jgi:hypothetical protein
MLSGPEITQLLARAFDQAWARYYRPGRVTMSADMARSALAKHLVEMAKGGILDKGELAAAGLLHLNHLCLKTRLICAHDRRGQACRRCSQYLNAEGTNM